MLVILIFAAKKIEKGDCKMDICDFKNWIRTAKGLYEYGIDDNLWYEIHIMYHYKTTDILTSNASLYIVRKYLNDEKDQDTVYFERKLLLNGTLAECLENLRKTN